MRIRERAQQRLEAMSGPSLYYSRSLVDYD
jgi:hypothetical protein